MPERRARIFVHPLFEQDHAQQLLKVGGLRILCHCDLRVRQRRIQAAALKVRRDLIGKRVFGLLRAQCPPPPINTPSKDTASRLTYEVFAGLSHHDVTSGKKIESIKKGGNVAARRREKPYRNRSPSVYDPSRHPIGGILMTRTRILCAALFLLTFASFLFAQDTKFRPEDEQIPGPDNAKTDTGQCCYRSGEIKDPAEAFKTWIEDVHALATRALDSHGL